MIHNTAIVSSKAEIGNNVEIGPFTIVEDKVKIGDNCRIGAHVTLASGTILSKDVKIFNGAVLGTVPQDLKFSGEETTLEIGERTVIREYAFLNRGTKDKFKTVIGKDCFLMAFVHVAHDCFIGDGCIIANGTQIAGHISVGNFTILSGHVLIHQFTQVGSYCMIEGGAKLKRDIPPYLMIAGEPARFSGLNKIGLKRRGFSEEDIQKLSDAYRIVYRNGLTTLDAIQKIEADYAKDPKVLAISEFLKKSKRGIVR
ncbi:MAG: acyl-ACP--UDP-N-acetylglucosamine O-acyltransferase [Candidatus Delongbacteria bacterium]|nr:acyl-ACP--UDP-N-acetylglucosamine O-acyltransferase [Candidatus Delongbacteria bacterium]MCG2761536.1 acyl-ACP--UDP-N-acetylglucosamine O-acyltransferase [Candidatus Delongbacteria bacterium]